MEEEATDNLTPNSREVLPAEQPTDTQETAKAEEETNQEICQGFKVDPLTKLHLCNACDYHRYRNRVKPWLKVKGD